MLVGSKSSEVPNPQSPNDQRELLKNALNSAEKAYVVTKSQRQAIREVSIAVGKMVRTPQQALVVFKAILSDAAMEEKRLAGRDTNRLLELFVSVFIEELFGNGAVWDLDSGERQLTNAASRLARTTDLPEPHYEAGDQPSAR
jgi:hypothetical protein